MSGGKERWDNGMEGEKGQWENKQGRWRQLWTGDCERKWTQMAGKYLARWDAPSSVNYLFFSLSAGRQVEAGPCKIV